MGDYEKLLARVLARFPELSREEVEAMVEAKLRESPLLNKVGALLLVAEELGAFESERPAEAPEIGYTKISELVPGLNDVSVRGVVYAVEGPYEVKGHRIMRLKLGDGSGRVEVTLWDERAEEAGRLGLKPGDQVAVLHAYTRERIETGAPELHVGRGGGLTKLEPEPGAPKPQSFYVGLSEALSRDEGVYDVVATVVEVGEERRVRTQFGDAVLREALLSDGEAEARLTAWRDKAGLLRELKPGEQVYITDVRVRDGRLTLTPRSILAMREPPTPEALKILEERAVGERLLRALDVVERPAGWAVIATDGARIIRVILPEKPGLRPGDHFKVRGAVQEKRRGKTYLLCREGGVEPEPSPEREIPLPERRLRLADALRPGFEGAEDVVVEGVLYTKTQLVSVETRFGAAERLGFWLKEGDAAVQGVAWRSKAREISEIPEGAEVRMKWVSVRINLFNEPEIHVESDTVIEVLSTPGEKG